MCNQFDEEERSIRGKSPVIVVRPSVPYVVSNENQLNDLEFDSIIGITNRFDDSGTLMFLFKWKYTEHSSLIPASIANRKYPQQLIQFYQNRFRME